MFLTYLTRRGQKVDVIYCQIFRDNPAVLAELLDKNNSLVACTRTEAQGAVLKIFLSDFTAIILTETEEKFINSGDSITLVHLLGLVTNVDSAGPGVNILVQGTSEPAKRVGKPGEWGDSFLNGSQSF